MPRPRKAAKKKSSKPEPTYVLNVTKDELAHIRNLMSVLLPPAGEVKLGESLAEACEMDESVDSSLWDKIWALCSEAGVDVGDEAPDFIVAHVDPTLRVYQVTLEEEE